MNDIKKINKNQSLGSRESIINQNDDIVWEAPESILYEKGTNWYIGLFAIAITTATILFWIKQYLGFAVAVLAPFVIFITSRKESKVRKFRLNKEGITVNDKSHPFSEFRAYFISYAQEIPILHLQKTRKLALPISAILIGINAARVEKLINLYLPENQKAAIPTSDLFSKWFRF